MFPLALWGIFTTTQLGTILLSWAIYPHYRSVAISFYLTLSLQLLAIVASSHVPPSNLSLMLLAGTGFGLASTGLAEAILDRSTPSSPHFIQGLPTHFLGWTAFLIPFLIAEPPYHTPANPLLYPLIAFIGGVASGVALRLVAKWGMSMTTPWGLDASRWGALFGFLIWGGLHLSGWPPHPLWVGGFGICIMMGSVSPTPHNRVSSSYQPPHTPSPLVSFGGLPDRIQSIILTSMPRFPSPLSTWIRYLGAWRQSRPIRHRKPLPTDTHHPDPWSGWVWNVGWDVDVSGGMTTIGQPCVSLLDHVPAVLDGLQAIYGPSQWGECGLWGQQESTLPSADWAMMRHLVTQASIQNGDTILECGNGGGGLTYYLAQRFPESTIIAVVPTHWHAERLTSHAQTMGYQNIKVGVATDSIFPTTGMVDRVVMGGMGAWGSSYQACWTQLKQCLRPSGIVVGYQPTHSQYSVRIAQLNNGVSDWVKWWIPQGYIPDLQSMMMAQTHFKWDGQWEIKSEMMARTLGAWRLQLNRVGVNRLVGLTGLNPMVWENCDRALYWMQTLFAHQSQFGVTVYRCTPIIE